jgi:TonB family protein
MDRRIILKILASLVPTVGLLVFAIVSAVSAQNDESGRGFALLPESWAREAAITTVVPEYPDEAIQQNVSGIVHVKFQTNDEGEVVRIKVRPRTAALLARAVAEAVKQWRFKPRLAADNIRKPVISRLIFSFTLISNEPKVQLYNPGPDAPDVQKLGYYNSAKEMKEWREWQEVLPERHQKSNVP